MSLLTAEETAAYLRVHTDDLYRLVAAGEVPAIRLGRRLRFDPQALAGLSDSRPAEPRPRQPKPAPQPAQLRVVASEPAPKPAAATAPKRRETSKAAKASKASAKPARTDPFADLLMTG